MPEVKEENGVEDSPPPRKGDRIPALQYNLFGFNEEICLFLLYLHFGQKTHWFNDVCRLSFESIRKHSSSVLLSAHKRGAWSLVCDTEEQWVRLADSIKDKTSPQDRHLYRVISQNFLPEISSMIEHKVRHKRDITISFYYSNSNFPLETTFRLVPLNIHVIIIR